jgi:uncharacterized protein YfaS (alpha-2-macroglobulin family)
VEAKLAGYNIPAGLLQQWTNYQKRKAQGWVTGRRRSELIQAYRLYTLALLGEPEMGAMNRLKERNNLPTTARWRLAAAYKLSGQEEAARSLAKGDMSINTYRELGNTYGSHLRDKAMILETLTMLNENNKAQNIVEELSSVLSSEKWLSTQTTAYMLIAIARYAGFSNAGATAFSFRYQWQNDPEQNISASSPIFQTDVAAQMDSLGSIRLKNESETIIYPRLILNGLPALGAETSASNGLSCIIAYTDRDGNRLDATKLTQGSEIIADVTVKNTGSTGDYEEIAVAHLVPSGWEIYNERMAGAESSPNFEYQDIRDDRVYTFFDLKQGEEKTIRLLLNASYIGEYYLPPVYVEAMYDATINTRVKGKWIEVVLPGAE